MCTWSSVVMAGDSPPWTQKMVLSITADKLHVTHDSMRLSAAALHHSESWSSCPMPHSRGVTAAGLPPKLKYGSVRT